MHLVIPRCRTAAVEDLIHIDEIGIETGRWQDYFIKTAYRPLYAPVRGTLHLSAVEALSVALLDWREQPAEALFGASRKQDRLIEALCLTLNLRNHANILQDDLGLWLDCRPRHSGDAAAMAANLLVLPRHLERMALQPSMVVCFVADARERDQSGARDLAQAARDAGFAVAIENFGASRDGPALLDIVAPDLVRIDTDLVRAISAVPRGRGLLGALVEALHAGGVEVAVGDITGADELEAVLSAAPDFLSGPYLAPHVLAGEPMGRETIQPGNVVMPGDNVIAFRR